LSRCKECTEEELCCEFRKRNRITEDSESSARWALSKCIGAQKKTELSGSSMKRILYQVGIE
jgi:hypothetical protein